MSKKVVIITGASSGIGLATAQLFTEKGYLVYGFSRRLIEGANFKQIQADVTDDASVKAAVDQVVAEAGRIDVLFNNAGFAFVGASEESSIAQIKSMFETNFFGAVRVANTVLPIMRRQKFGRLIHTSSISGLIPVPFMGYYAASKHALEAYSEALDHEVRGFGIRSTLVEPSFMKTAINSHEINVDLPVKDYESARKRINQSITTGVAKSPPPSLVADKVLEIVETKSPALRYLVGRDAKILATLRRILPGAYFEKAIRAQFKLD